MTNRKKADEHWDILRLENDTVKMFTSFQANLWYGAYENSNIIFTAKYIRIQTEK